MVEGIVHSAVEAKDMISAFGKVKVSDEDYELLLPLVKRVVDAAATLLDSKDMEHSHRLSQLKSVMSEVSQQLIDPEIMTNLK